MPQNPHRKDSQSIWTRSQRHHQDKMQIRPSSSYEAKNREIGQLGGNKGLSIQWPAIELFTKLTLGRLLVVAKLASARDDSRSGSRNKKVMKIATMRRQVQVPRQKIVEITLVRLIWRRAKTASALKRIPGPSSSEKTMLVWNQYIHLEKYKKEREKKKFDEELCLKTI